MKRRWNIYIWGGFLITLAGLLSYQPFFIRFPVTRDIPWVNYLMFAAGVYLLVVGLRRAFRQPELYHGKVSGPVLGFGSLLMIGFFLFGVFYVSKQLPASKAAPRVGEKAPDFTLPDINGKPVSLRELLASSPAGQGAAGGKGALLVFYRGYW